MAVNFDLLQGSLGIDVSKWQSGFEQAGKVIERFRSTTDAVSAKVIDGTSRIGDHLDKMTERANFVTSQIQGRMVNAWDAGFKAMLAGAIEAGGGIDAVSQKIAASGETIDSWIAKVERGSTTASASLNSVASSSESMATSITSAVDKASAKIDELVSKSPALSQLSNEMRAASSPGVTPSGSGEYRISADQKRPERKPGNPHEYGISGQKKSIDDIALGELDHFGSSGGSSEYAIGEERGAKAKPIASSSSSISASTYDAVIAGGSKGGNGLTQAMAAASAAIAKVEMQLQNLPPAAHLAMNAFPQVGMAVQSATSLLSTFGTTGTAVLGSIGASAGPVIATGAAIYGAYKGISYAIEKALEKSESARDMFDGMMSKVNGLIDQFTSGVGKEWDAFWKENGKTIEDVAVKVGEFFVFLGKGAVDLIAPLVSFLIDEFLHTLKAVFSVLGIVVDSFKLLASLLSGDTDAAVRASTKIFAGMQEVLATLVEKVGQLIKFLTFGWTDGGMKELGAILREDAKDARDAANAMDELARAKDRVSKAGTEKTADATTASTSATANGSTGSAPSGHGSHGHSGGSSPGSKGHSPGKSILDQDFGTAEAQQALASMTTGQGKEMLSQMKREIEAAMTPDDKGVMKPGTAINILSKYKSVLSQIPGFADHEFEKVADVIKFRIGQAVANSATPAIRDVARSAIGEATHGSHIFGDDTGKHKKDKPEETVKALNPEDVGRLFGDTFSKSTREQSMKTFHQLGRDIQAALKPDAKGIIDPKNAETILANYRLILSQMPGFAKDEFEKVAKVISQQISAASKAGGSKMVVDLAQETIGNVVHSKSSDGVFAGGTKTKADKHVKALDDESVDAEYGGVLSSVKKPQAMKEFQKIGQDIMKHLKPDANGIIDPKDAETILNNYRVVLSKMPGFAREEFNKVAKVISDQIAMVTKSGGSELVRNVAADNIEKATGDATADKVFKRATNETPEERGRRKFKEATPNQIQGAMANFSDQASDQIGDLRKQNLAGVKGIDGKSLRVEDDMRQLVQFKQQVIAAMAEARKATGDAKEDAVAKVDQLLGKYNETYDKIKSKIDGTYKEAAKASEDSANRQVSSADRVRGANERVTAPQGVRGGGSSGGSSGSSGGGSQANTSMMNNFNSSMNMIANLGQALAGAMNMIGGVVGSGAATEAALEQAVTDPIEKISLAMQRVGSRLDMAMSNIRNTGGNEIMARDRNSLQEELEKLTKAREDAIRQREIDRQSAADASARWEREQRAKRLAQEALAAEQLKETQMSIIKAVGGGPQTAITINGVNDPRQIFDVMEREALRRGMDLSGRRGANFGAKK